MQDLKSLIRTIPDYPKKGIMFRDVTTLLGNAAGFRAAIQEMAAPFAGAGVQAVAGIEARGFILGGAIADKLGCGFVMLRKRGKLPGRVIGHDYALEYGTDRIEVQEGMVPDGARVVVVDDLLATGGTMAAGIALLRQVGAVVPAAAALIELSFLGGRKRLDVPVETLIAYDE